LCLRFSQWSRSERSSAAFSDHDTDHVEVFIMYDFARTLPPQTIGSINSGAFVSLQLSSHSSLLSAIRGKLQTSISPEILAAQQTGREINSSRDLVIQNIVSGSVSKTIFYSNLEPQ